MFLLAGFWPITLTVYFGGFALLIRRAWVNRKNKNTARAITICASLQILAPIIGTIVARITWRAYGDNFAIDPREALIASATLLTIFGSLLTGLLIGRNNRSQQSVAAYVAQSAPSAEP